MKELGKRDNIILFSLYCIDNDKHLPSRVLVHQTAQISVVILKGICVFQERAFLKGVCCLPLYTEQYTVYTDSPGYLVIVVTFLETAVQYKNLIN